MKPGQRVNIEIDMLARYVARLTEYKPIMKTEKSKAAVEQTRAHILILEARFYGDICDELCRGAIAAHRKGGRHLGAHGGSGRARNSRRHRRRA